jgi:hypothetical protein
VGSQRVGDTALSTFVRSPGNLAGCGLAAVGVALHLVGVAGGVWWPLLVVALYACGFAVARSRSRRPGVVVVDPAPGPDLAAIRSALDRVEARSIDLPDELALPARLIVKGLRDLLLRIDLRQAGSADSFVVSRIATEYLPATIDDYLSIPRSQARLLRGANGKTAFEMAQGQLALLTTQVTEVTDALVRGDHDRLAAQGHFLESRFATSPLSLPPADPGATTRPEA